MCLDVSENVMWTVDEQLACTFALQQLHVAAEVLARGVLHAPVAQSVAVALGAAGRHGFEPLASPERAAAALHLVALQLRHVTLL